MEKIPLIAFAPVIVINLLLAVAALVLWARIERSEIRGYQSGRWSVGGFAADPPTLASALADDSNDQLVQVMAGFGGDGAAEGLNPAAFGSDISQPLLTMSQHG